MNRRRFLAASGSGGLALLSGCIFRQNTYPTFTAAPISVPPYIRKQTGFAAPQILSAQKVADVSYNDETRTVKTDSWRTVLKHEASSPSRPAIALLFSTPNRQIGSRTLSPAFDSSVGTVIENHLDGVTTVQLGEERQRSNTIDTLGIETPVMQRTAEIDYKGQTHTGTVYTTIVRNSDDKLLLAGIQSDTTLSRESEFLTLFQSIIHPYDRVQSPSQ